MERTFGLEKTFSFHPVYHVYRFDLEKLFGRVSGTLSTTQGILSTLGINPPQTDKSAPIGGKDSYTPPSTPKDNTLLIVAGVVLALGVVGFVIYKAKN